MQSLRVVLAGSSPFWTISLSSDRSTAALIALLRPRRQLVGQILQRVPGIPVDRHA